MDEDLAKALGLEHAHGALVGDVEPASPAQKSGIRSGDVIVAVDGQDVPHSEDLPRLVARHAPGTQVKLAVMRDHQKSEVDVTLAALKEDGDHADSSPQAPGASPSDHASALGIAVAEEDGHVVVARVASDGPSDGKLRPGDVIEEIGGQRVGSAGDLASKVRASAAGKPILLRVKRADQLQYVAIDPGSKR